MFKKLRQKRELKKLNRLCGVYEWTESKDIVTISNPHVPVSCLGEPCGYYVFDCIDADGKNLPIEERWLNKYIINKVVEKKILI